MSLLLTVVFVHVEMSHRRLCSLADAEDTETRYVIGYRFMLRYNINDTMEGDIIQVYCQSRLILDVHNLSRQQFQKVMEFDLDSVFYNRRTGCWRLVAFLAL